MVFIKKISLILKISIINFYIPETSMGVSINAQEKPFSEYVTAVKQ